MIDLSERRKKYPLGATETALELLEPAWVDFSWGVRSGRRVIRSASRSGLRGRTLATVHRLLEQRHHQDFLAGKRIAIFSALVLCAEENVPLPYWLADELLAIARQVNESPASLHDLLGLGDVLPVDGAKAHTARENHRLQGELWSAATLKIAKAKQAGRRLSVNSAIKEAMEDLHFPYAKTKAREMFDAQERIQNAHSEAVQGIKKHRIVK